MIKLITEEMVEEAFESEFDGVESFLLVQEILELREKLERKILNG